jgi:hypothetical protein
LGQSFGRSEMPGQENRFANNNRKCAEQMIVGFFLLATRNGLA